MNENKPINILIEKIEELRTEVQNLRNLLDELVKGVRE